MIHTDDLHEGGVLRAILRRARFTKVDTEHVVRIDHLYGPAENLAWGVPICGAPEGRVLEARALQDAAPRRDVRQCGTCRRMAERLTNPTPPTCDGEWHTGYVLAVGCSKCGARLDAAGKETPPTKWPYAVARQM